jgi:prepilin-type processing-associated H-X9-DG protein
MRPQLRLSRVAPRRVPVAKFARLRVTHSPRRPRASGITVPELIVVIALLPLLMAGCLMAGGRSRETANRVKCASNLRQIGQAILLYCNDNGGNYPRTIYVSGPMVAPAWGTGAEAPNPFKEGGPAPNDVTAALYLLLRTQDITSEVFVCPSSNAERWDFGGGGNTALNWSNWRGKNGIRLNLSYSFQNPYPDQSVEPDPTKPMLTNSISAEFAVAADLNPGLTGGNGGVLGLTTTSSARDMKAGNSDNHERDGQNVLYGDGHVEFMQNPFAGVQRDNIYCRRASSTGFAPAPGPIGQSPYDVNDSVLLPTAD